MPDSSGSIDLGNLSQEEKEVIEKMAEENPPEEGEHKPKVLTAFTVVVDYEGNPQVLAYETDDFLVQSHPTRDLIFAACSVILKDIQAGETAEVSAQMTAQILAQQAEQMRQQMHQQAEAQRIAAGLNLSGPRRG